MEKLITRIRCNIILNNNSNLMTLLSQAENALPIEVDVFENIFKTIYLEVEEKLNNPAYIAEINSIISYKPKVILESKSTLNVSLENMNYENKKIVLCYFISNLIFTEVMRK